MSKKWYAYNPNEIWLVEQLFVGGTESSTTPPSCFELRKYGKDGSVVIESLSPDKAWWTILMNDMIAFESDL